MKFQRKYTPASRRSQTVSGTLQVLRLAVVNVTVTLSLPSDSQTRALLTNLLTNTNGASSEFHLCESALVIMPSVANLLLNNHQSCRQGLIISIALGSMGCCVNTIVTFHTTATLYKTEYKNILEQHFYHENIKIKQARVIWV